MDAPEARAQLRDTTEVVGVAVRENDSRRARPAALGDGIATIPEMVKRIYAEVSPALHPVAAQSVESHLKKLEREGRASESVVRDAPSLWRLV